MSSNTQFVRYQYCAHLILQVIQHQKVLHVIRYPYSMSSSTQFMFWYLHFPCSGTFNVLALVPSQSFSTNTFYNHLVPTLASTYICFPFSNQTHRVRHQYKVVPKSLHEFVAYCSNYGLIKLSFWLRWNVILSSCTWGGNSASIWNLLEHEINFWHVCTPPSDKWKKWFWDNDVIYLP